MALAGPAGRRPVLLLPGWRDGARALGPLARSLVTAGWPAELVRPVSFRDPFGSNVAHAAELADALETLRHEAGGRIDVVAHSMGGLALRYYLKERRDHGVGRAVFLATPHTGTWLAWLAFGRARPELMRNSGLVRSLGPLPPDVPAICIHSPWDLRVLPRHSARLDGVPSMEIRGVTHRGMLRSRRVHAAVRAALTEGWEDPTLDGISTWL